MREAKVNYIQFDNAGAEEDSFQLINPRHAAYFLYALVGLCFLADRFGWLS